MSVWTLVNAPKLVPTHRVIMNALVLKITRNWKNPCQNQQQGHDIVHMHIQRIHFVRQQVCNVKPQYVSYGVFSM